MKALLPIGQPDPQIWLPSTYLVVPGVQTPYLSSPVCRIYMYVMKYM